MSPFHKVLNSWIGKGKDKAIYSEEEWKQSLKTSVQLCIMSWRLRFSAGMGMTGQEKKGKSTKPSGLWVSMPKIATGMPSQENGGMPKWRIQRGGTLTQQKSLGGARARWHPLRIPALRIKTELGQQRSPGAGSQQGFRQCWCWIQGGRSLKGQHWCSATN